MAEKYYSILTNRGKTLEAAASVSGVAVVLKDFVIGDGNGVPVTPDPAKTSLSREVYRSAISSLEVSPDQDNQFIAHLVIPANVGGFTVREVGLLTDAGELYAVSNSPAIEKPESGINVNLQFRLAVSETANIELKVATGDGLFLRQDANLGDVKDKDASRKNLGLGDSATKNVGTSPGSVAAADDSRIVNALQKGNNLSDLTGKSTARNNLGLGSSATHDTEYFVPATRKVNNKQLNADITLNASDVGAISSAGGNYQAIIRMGGVETLATEPSAANLSALYSAPSPIQSGSIAAGGLANWYGYQGMWGLIRNASTGITGWGVQINGITRFTVAPDGSLYSNSDKMATELFVRQNFVQDVRLGSETTAPVSTHNPGFVLTAFDAVSGGASVLYWRPVQKLINNQWVTVVGI